MTKHWAISFGILGAIIGIIIATSIALKQSSDHESVHYHAGFQVYVDNEIQDFSDLKYMSLKPCKLHEEEAELTPEQIQNEKAHLHDVVGDVVHSHQEGAIWGDLFTNIGYEIPDETRQAYVNGELYDGDIFTKPIEAYESVVILVGSNDDVPGKLAGAVTEEHIRDIEAQSESCGAN